MSHRRIVKSRDNTYSIETVRYPLFNRSRDFLDSEDQNIKDLPLKDILKSHPDLDSLIKEAENEAEAIIQNAHHKAAVIEEQAKCSGYNMGFETGYENATKEIQLAIQSVSETLKKVVDDLVSLKHKILNQSESDIVRLVIEIAKKLVCNELRQNPDTIISIAKKAIELAQNKSEIIIKVHPDDYGILKQHADQLISQLSEANSFKSPLVPPSDGRSLVPPSDGKTFLRIEEDPELSRGGCIAVTDTSLIDMSLETRLEMLDHLLTNSDH